MDMSTGQQKHILIAEDEKPYLRALVLKMQNAGFKVTGAENGVETLAALKKERFDLLLLDLIMPKVNGFMVLEEIKKLGLKLPVIVLSNLSQADDEKKVRDLGAVDFLGKSNTPIAELTEKVKALIGGIKNA